MIPAPRLIIIGLGTIDGLNSFILRSSAATGLKKARDLGCRNIGLANFGSDSGKLNPEENAQVIIEGALLGLYRWRRNHTTVQDRSDVDRIIFSAPENVTSKEIAFGISNGQAISEGVCLARDLVNQSPNNLNLEKLAKAAEDMASDTGVLCSIHDVEWIKTQEMNSILAVGQGSINQPRFIELEYKGSSDAPTVLIGKGLTFDSGGISIKPASRGSSPTTSFR